MTATSHNMKARARRVAQIVHVHHCLAASGTVLPEDGAPDTILIPTGRDTVTEYQ